MNNINDFINSILILQPTVHDAYSIVDKLGSNASLNLKVNLGMLRGLESHGYSVVPALTCFLYMPVYHSACLQLLSFSTVFLMDIATQ